MITNERLEELKNKLTYLCMAEHEGKKFEFQDLYDLEDLISQEQSRRAVQPEEVNNAIKWIQEKRDFSKNTDDGKANILCLKALRQMEEKAQWITEYEKCKSLLSELSKLKEYYERQMQGWIPCSKRLPTKEDFFVTQNPTEYFLLTLINGEEESREIEIISIRDFEEISEYFEYRHITHWMRLPELLKEKA